MSFQSLRPVCAALLAAGMFAGTAHAQSMPEFKFSGFGTLAIVHSDDRNADFTSTIFQPNGVGFSRATSIEPDSKLGAQLDAVFNDRFSAVLQLVSQHGYDNSFTPRVEWANVKWQVTPQLSVRGGRIAAPSFLISDTLNVGYSQPWVRPPVEVYEVLPITRNDGADVTWRSTIGGFGNTVQAYYGTSTGRLKSGSAKASPSWGFNDTVQSGDLTLRAGYTALDVDLNFPGVSALLGGLGAFSAVPGPVGATATALANKYSTDNMNLRAFSVGGSYDPGRWFAMGEFVHLRGDGILANSNSWYVVGGYRYGSFTPYLVYARTRSSVTAEAGIPLAAAAPVNAGLNAALNNQFNGKQATVSAGVRWDFARNTALKLQYDHVDLGANSAGRFTNVQPAFERGGSVNLFSAALDFVF